MEERSIMKIEPALRMIGGVVVASVLLGDLRPSGLPVVHVVRRLNLFQSAFTQWCPMMAILRKAGVRG
jgi:hypothetical protein